MNFQISKVINSFKHFCFEEKQPHFFFLINCKLMDGNRAIAEQGGWLKAGLIYRN